MLEITNELIYEVLKRVQDQCTRMGEDIGRLRDEMSAMRGHLVAMQHDIHNLYEHMIEHGKRLDRIERRLELTDASA
jgi:DNA anti-recombination protein RmuC